MIITASYCIIYVHYYYTSMHFDQPIAKMGWQAQIVASSSQLVKKTLSLRLYNQIYGSWILQRNTNRHWGFEKQLNHWTALIQWRGSKGTKEWVRVRRGEQDGVHLRIPKSMARQQIRWNTSCFTRSVRFVYLQVFPNISGMELLTLRSEITLRSQALLLTTTIEKIKNLLRQANSPSRRAQPREHWRSRRTGRWQRKVSMLGTQYSVRNMITAIVSALLLFFESYDQRTESFDSGEGNIGSSWWYEEI